MAGVMAHEIAHVALRHGTAQATKGQKFQVGAIAGQILGAIVGGAAGSVIAQGSQFGLGAYFLKYGREYERQADLLGAQIMARAGYDPREMANMFRTIQEQGGRSGPEWLSSHPNPGNRYNAIVNEVEIAAGPGQRQHRTVRLDQDAAGRDVARLHGRADRARDRTRSGRTSRYRPAGAPHRRTCSRPQGRIGPHQPAELPARERAVELGRGRERQRRRHLRAGRRRSSGRQRRHRVHARRADRRCAGGSGNLQRDTQQLLNNFARSNPDLQSAGNARRENIGGRTGLTTPLQQCVGSHRRARIHHACRRRSCGTAACSTSSASRRSRRRISTRSAFRRVRQSVQIAD